MLQLTYENVPDLTIQPITTPVSPDKAPVSRKAPVSKKAPVLAERPSVQTSLVEVTDLLSKKPPCRVFFKNELEQPSGSFKLRGIGHLIQQSIIKARNGPSPQKEIRVFASSGGNAGLAAAYLAHFYRVKCTVVVPTIAMSLVVEKLQRFGAQVVLHGETISEADQYARHLMAQSSGVHTIYCHPFDNPLIWEGHSQMMDEVFTQLKPEEHAKVSAVVCSVGGGGLYNGIMAGLKKNQSSANCVLVETAQAPTLTEAVKAKAVVTLKSVKSVATSLACSYVSQPTLDNFFNETNKTHLRAIDDLEAVKGSISYHNDFGSCVEPACGAAVLVVYNQMDYLRSCLPGLCKDDIVVVVVCGGSCSNEESMRGYRAMVRQAKL